MNDRLVPHFIPSLSSILLNKEDEKGSPLTKEEVEEILNKSSVVMVTEDDYAKLTESRGYEDIDPENCWYDWQMLRREIGRKPDMEPGIRVSMINRDDPEVVATVQKARQTVSRFVELFRDYGVDYLGSIKYLVEDLDSRANMWLTVEDVGDGEFQAYLYEVPDSFRKWKAGDRFRVPMSEILDWMFVVDGALYGGYSLRCSRSKMNSVEQRKFDEHMGVTSYKPA